jgi:hypothetical protein
LFVHVLLLFLFFKITSMAGTREGAGGPIQSLTETDLTNGVAAIRGDAIQMYSYLSREQSQFAFDKISTAMETKGFGKEINPDNFYPHIALLSAFNEAFDDVEGIILLHQFGRSAGRAMFGGFSEQTGATGLDGFLGFVDMAMPGQYQEIHHGDPAIKVQGIENNPQVLDSIVPAKERFDPKTGKGKLVFYSQTYYGGPLESGILSGAMEVAGIEGNVEMYMGDENFRLKNSIPGENGKWREDLAPNYYVITIN